MAITYLLFLRWCCRLAPGLEWSPAPRELVLPHESISIGISCIDMMMDIKARLWLIVEALFQNLPSSDPSFPLSSLKVEDWLGMLKMLPCVWKAFTQWEKTRVLQLCPWCSGTQKMSLRSSNSWDRLKKISGKDFCCGNPLKLQFCEIETVDSLEVLAANFPALWLTSASLFEIKHMLPSVRAMSGRRLPCLLVLLGPGCCCKRQQIPVPNWLQRVELKMRDGLFSQHLRTERI